MEERVQKIIANAGYCSRRDAEELIIKGKVKVNGKAIKIGDKADSEKDEVTVDGKAITKTKKLYLAFNKPPDCLTTLDDPEGRKTILAYIKLPQRVIPIGRLDFKTEGLLLLTSDGEFANKVMHPRYEVRKTYNVYLDKEFLEKDAEQVRRGIKLEDFTTNTAEVRHISPKKDVIEIIIHEGQNRVIRRMMEALGYRVRQLRRIKVGTIELGDLPLGKWRELTPQEVEQFMKK